MTAYENLANAVILQAVKDCRSALESLKEKPPGRNAAGRVNECERFFRSRLYGILTSVDGEYLIRKLREEAEKL